MLTQSVNRLHLALRLQLSLCKFDEAQTSQKTLHDVRLNILTFSGNLRSDGGKKGGGILESGRL